MSEGLANVVVRLLFLLLAVVRPLLLHFVVEACGHGVRRKPFLGQQLDEVVYSVVKIYAGAEISQSQFLLTSVHVGSPFYITDNCFVSSPQTRIGYI